MNRKLLIVAVAGSFACWKGEASLGNCSTNADCPAGSTCNQSARVCQYACATLCAANEICESGLCVVKGPEVKQVSVPTTWVKRSGTVHVTAVVDGTGGPGLDSAFLQIAGQPDIAGTTSETGISRTYAFDVPGSVQAAGSEAPVAFTIRGKDTAGQVTRDAAAGTGQLLIDDAGPTVNGVTVNGGVAVSGIKWFKPAPTGNIDVQVSIQDAGSGVETTSLTLVSSGRLDVGTPSCTLTAQTQTCHFSVPLNTPQVPAGGQRRIAVAVAGADAAGNSVKTNAAALGIDDKPPVITFNPTYPAAGLDCVSDANLYCGHDGSHFFRAGDGKYSLAFTVNDTYPAPDDVGSGADQSKGTCVIAGASACTVTYNSGTSSFTFSADFSEATFSSAADGTGDVSVTVNAKDAVGNAAAPVSATVHVTRVRWVRQLPAALSGAPVLSEKLGQVIAAGTNLSGDSIFSMRTADGSVAWSAGSALSPAVTTVASNMALDTTPSTDLAHPTPILYVNSGDNFYALHIANNAIDKYCTNSVTGLVGAPVIFSAGSGALGVVAGAFTVHAFAFKPATGGGCTEDIPFVAFGNSSVHPTLGPPSANGTAVYFGYDNSANPPPPNDLGLRSIQFSGTAFSSPASVNIGRQPTTNTSPTSLTPAADLFFGVNGDHTFYRYGPDLSARAWTVTPLNSNQNIFAPPVVSGGLVYASSTALYAFKISDAQTAWQYGTNLTQVSPPAFGTRTLFISDQAGRQVAAVDPTTRLQRWAYAGAASTTPPTRLSSVATEAVIGSDTVLYFGDTGGRLYALVGDDLPLPTAAGDWPRTGYDNCNSNHANNPGFTCQ